MATGISGHRSRPGFEPFATKTPHVPHLTVRGGVQETMTNQPGSTVPQMIPCGTESYLGRFGARCPRKWFVLTNWGPLSRSLIVRSCRERTHRPGRCRIQSRRARS